MEDLLDIVGSIEMGVVLSMAVQVYLDFAEAKIKVKAF